MLSDPLHDEDRDVTITEVRHNVNESIPRDFTEQELRASGLRDALSYFTYVQMPRSATGPTQPPVGITTVLEIADHFAAYVRDGVKPQKSDAAS